MAESAAGEFLFSDASEKSHSQPIEIYFLTAKSLYSQVDGGNFRFSDCIGFAWGSATILRER